jgi:hypothetical protein
LKVLSNWRSVRLWETQVERDLHRTCDLRAHGFAIGTFTLLLMWAVSHLQMRWGVQTLALRCFLTLGVGHGINGVSRGRAAALAAAPGPAAHR